MYVHKRPNCSCLTKQVRNKLAQLVNVRRHKMEEGLRQISGTATVRVNGLGAYELNLIRNNFQGALDMFLKLEAVRLLSVRVVARASASAGQAARITTVVRSQVQFS
jgi:hypothetical protein